MKNRTCIFLFILGALCTIGSVCAQELGATSTTGKPHKNWFLSYELNRFSENVSIGLSDVPTGDHSYDLRHTLFAGKVGVGYRVSPKVSLAFQYAKGPDDRLEIGSGREIQETFRAANSRFLSFVVNREFPIGMRRSIDAKIGLTRADVESRRRDESTGWTVFRSIERKPLVALGFRHEFSMRWSGVAEITNYFLSEPGSVTTASIGIRCDL